MTVQRVGKAEALNSLRPTSDFVLKGDEILEWLDGSTTPPSTSEINTEIARLQVIADATEYKGERARQYPAIGDQLDMLWHAVDGDDALKTTYADFHAAIKAVKDANPKG